MSEKEVDIYRDTPVRLLGYANEVGEAFRALVPVNVVRFSYLVAGVYCVADTADKTQKESLHRTFANDGERNKRLVITAADTLIWQGLASVAVPGLFINRTCALSLRLLTRYSKLSTVKAKWTTTAIGLGTIPFIVKPIDHGVDLFLDKTIRLLFKE